jgi:hypothetical protein
MAGKQSDFLRGKLEEVEQQLIEMFFSLSRLVFNVPVKPRNPF